MRPSVPGRGRGQRADLLRRGLDAVAVVEPLVPDLVTGPGERAPNLRSRDAGDAVGAVEPELAVGRLDDARHAAQRLAGGAATGRRTGCRGPRARARRARPRRSGPQSTLGRRRRRWRAPFPRRACSGWNTRTESPTTSTSWPPGYPSHVRPLLSAVMTLARLPSSPCRGLETAPSRPPRVDGTRRRHARSPPRSLSSSVARDRLDLAQLGIFSGQGWRQGHGRKRVTLALPESATADPDPATEIAVDARQHRRGIDPRGRYPVTDPEQGRRRHARLAATHTVPFVSVATPGAIQRSRRYDRRELGLAEPIDAGRRPDPEASLPIVQRGRDEVSTHARRAGERDGERSPADGLPCPSHLVRRGGEPQTDEAARSTEGHRGMIAGPCQGVDAGIGVRERAGGRWTSAAVSHGKHADGAGGRPRPSRPGRHQQFAVAPECRPLSTRASRSAPPLAGGRRSRLPPPPRPTHSRRRAQAR